MDEYLIDYKYVNQNDWKWALQAESAVNLSGVVISFAEVVQRIWQEAHEIGKGTGWVNGHPICLLYARAVYCIAGCPSGYDMSHDGTYEFVEKMSQ
jgi:hypothetical protein